MTPKIRTIPLFAYKPNYDTIGCYSLEQKWQKALFKRKIQNITNAKFVGVLIISLNREFLIAVS